jgi:tripartite ATP-independent transporter DctM subunit
MGELLFRSGASQHLYGGISPWVERIPGRLLHSNILACTVFAAVSGSSAATCATIGTVAVPELKRLGYDEGIALGSLAGAGTLGLLIPPSITMIVYGAITAESIGQLFLGGIIPGLMISALFMLYIGAAAIRKPSLAPVGRSYSWRERGIGLIEIMPVGVVILLVLGLIYMGITTPTEAGAVGAVCAFATVVLYRNLSWRVIKEASWNALRTSCMIMIIIAGATVLSSTLGYLLIPQWLAATVEASGLNPYLILAILCVIYIGLGCLFDGISMMVLTLPIVYPMIIAMGFHGIWFGVLQITPPVGFNLYVLQTISGRSIGMIVRNTVPFFLCLILAVVILILVPDLALIIPTAMIGR